MNLKRLISTSIALGISGAGIGWMIGLSASPVVQSVTTALLTLLTTLAVFVAIGVGPERLFGASFQPDERRAPSQNLRVLALWFVAGLVVAIATGGTIGIYARTNDWLGASPTGFVERWKVTGKKDDELAMRLLDELYPTTEVANRNLQSSSPLRGHLFAVVAADEYEELMAARGVALERLMKESDNEHVRMFANACEGNEQCLEAAVKHLIQQWRD